MDFGPSATGLVLLCDDQGIIQQILHDSVGGSQALVLGRSVTQMVEPASLEKMLNFLVELRTRQAAFDWELNVLLAGQVTTLHLTGVSAGKRLLILGSKSSQGVRQLYQDIMQMNNEQINTLRMMMKDQSQARRAQDTDLYDELSRLNNQLVTLQRELAKKNAELARLNTQKNQFLGMASHDLRSPLAAIISYSEFLLDEAAQNLSKEHLEFLSIIRTSSDFMLSLVNNLLDVSAIESGKLELDLQPVDLAVLVKDNINLNKVLAARKDITLHFDCAANLPPAMVDRYKIEQVLNNLIGNAIKFSYPGSQVTVHLTSDSGQAVIAVRDAGQGIPPAELDKLFKPFARTSVRSTGGEKSTGLGLMIARKVIEAHHGHIGVNSVVGEGSTFYFTLPLPEAVPAAATPQVEQAKTVQAGQSLRILVADDSIVNQKIIVRLLERAGYQADTVSSGKAACEAMQRRPYQVILMDLHMPEMDGIEATQFIRRQLPAQAQPVIIAITASEWQEDIDKCLAAGMDDYFSKPIRLDTLVEKLKRIESPASAQLPG